MFQTTNQLAAFHKPDIILLGKPSISIRAIVKTMANC